MGAVFARVQHLGARASLLRGNGAAMAVKRLSILHPFGFLPEPHSLCGKADRSWVAGETRLALLLTFYALCPKRRNLPLMRCRPHGPILPATRAAQASCVVSGKCVHRSYSGC